MSVHVVLQYAVVEAEELPDAEAFERWAQAALGQQDETELLIRIVDENESAQLNKDYRSKPGPTNVLSFPFELPQQVSMQKLEMELRPLGDLVMCAPVVMAQALAQGKSKQAHWAHLTVHGILHLLGMDHQTKDETELMEIRETRILNGLGFSSPYE